MSSFEGKVVIVTGTGTGTGAATARHFLQEGASVVLNGRREQKLTETAAGSHPVLKKLVNGSRDIGKHCGSGWRNAFPPTSLKANYQLMTIPKRWLASS